MSIPPGTAHIKAEYLFSANPTVDDVPDDDAAEGSGPARSGGRMDDRDIRSGGGAARGAKLSKAQKKERSGMNKGRRFGRLRDEVDLCFHVASGSVCEFGEKCRNNHDIEAYLAAKPADLKLPQPGDAIPFPESAEEQPNRKVVCPVFEETGDCRYGYRCRFLSAHLNTGSGTPELIKDAHKIAHAAGANITVEANRISSHALKLLRTKKYPFPIAQAYQNELEGDKTDAKPAEVIVFAEPDQEMEDVEAKANGDAEAKTNGDAAALPTVELPPQPSIMHENADELIAQRTGDHSPEHDGAPDVPMRFSEKKRLDWRGMTYLAPLTTVGNLPFRRLCVSYGADITCGEMGLATSFLAGSKEEWSLVRRHASEKTFGVQLAGSRVAPLVSAAEAIARECGDGVDFVDLNCGCPIDLVFKTGSGSALLDTPSRLGKIVAGMSRALGAIPVTVKLRTGVKDAKLTAHKLMPRLAPEFGAGCITVHGRTRQQRYTKLADWEYIKGCVDAVRAREADEDLPRVPIFGGGDCFSSSGYWSCVESSGVDGVMVGRGALIKPWIFTEIKERREWDISARERLDGIRNYAEYGLSHFGTDTSGVNQTRRYLCEALSFQYRYVPIGLLERLPARINERAPAFRGRDELETLLASGDSRDWVRISEMFLGKAPEGWAFVPKHKSNSYESQG